MKFYLHQKYSWNFVITLNGEKIFRLHQFFFLFSLQPNIHKICFLTHFLSKIFFFLSFLKFTQQRGLLTQKKKKKKKVSSVSNFYSNLNGYLVLLLTQTRFLISSFAEISFYFSLFPRKDLRTQKSEYLNLDPPHTLTPDPHKSNGD